MECRSLWQPIELIFWTQHCSVQVVLTERWSFLIQMSRHVPLLLTRVNLKLIFGVQAREHILRIHSRKMNLVRGVDLKSIASKLPTASGAECKAVCTEAGMFALRERRMHVTQEDFEMAVAKVMQKDLDRDMSIVQLFK